MFPAGGSGADAAALSGGLRAAVLDVGATGVISSMPLDDPTFEASGAARPRGVKIAEQVFVSWESLSGGLVRSRFAELSTVAGSNLGATTIRDLPAVAGFSDTGNPAIADLPRWSKHVVIGVWEHDSLSSGRPIPDLEYTMRPLPLLTLDGGG